jgi:hypothetical protein
MMIYRDFWEAGYKIFGLYGATDGKCDCERDDCEAILKHPRSAHWQHTPHWSEEQIEAMEESGQLETGYGVLVSGLLVIDVDARNGGIQSFARLCADVPAVTGAGLIVETGSGGGSRHMFFAMPSDIALVTKHNSYPGIDFKSSGYVVGAGSLHASGKTYNVLVGTPYDIEAAPAELIALLKKPEHYRSDGKDISDSDIAGMLAAIDPDCDYETWIRCGMATHHATQGAGFSMWNEWSSQGQKYPGPKELEKKWHSFGKSKSLATIGTLVHFSRECGYQEQVTFESDVDWDNSDFIDVSDIDLRRPPGFAGELAAFINSQCRFARENIAAIAAIVALGNITGLRYEDDITGATGNLFAFCVSGSATGKEAVNQAVIEIHRAAGISQAVYGQLKSEQEVYRNLARHQAAYYLIDEIGITLQKIVNAQKKGGAPYLDGIIGVLMSAYSKADGYMLLTGDMKETIKAQLITEIAKAEKGQDYADELVAELNRQIKSLENGLEKPFLSMIGYTTPVTFESVGSYEQATNGFLGRSIVVRERDTNPMPKKRFRKAEMSETLKNTLMTLFSPGEFETNPLRKVEWRKQRVFISTAKDAEKMLDEISDWMFHDFAEGEKENSGLEAVARRGYELVCKVSLILASATGIRTVEHVRWAFALIKRDLSEKIGMVQAQADNNITAKILAVIDTQHAESTSVIINRCRPSKKSDIVNELNRLESSGRIEKVLVKHAQTAKKTIEKWRLTN